MNHWGSAPHSKRRDKLFIIAEILEIAEEKTLKTQIMYRANLSYTQLNEYIAFMLKIGLLSRSSVNGKRTYRTTDKGLSFLQRYVELAELLKTEEDNCGKNGIKIPPPHLLKRSQNQGMR